MSKMKKLFLGVLAGILGSIILAIIAGVSGAGWWSLLVLFLGWASVGAVSGWYWVSSITTGLRKGIGRSL